MKPLGLRRGDILPVMSTTRRPIREELPMAIDIGPLLPFLGLPHLTTVTGSDGDRELWRMTLFLSEGLSYPSSALALLPNDRHNIESVRRGSIHFGPQSSTSVLFAHVTSRRGGFSRWWFVCPGCNRKASSLYLPQHASIGPDSLVCRNCVRLTYPSSRFSGKARRRIASDQDWPCMRAEISVIRAEERRERWNNRRRFWRKHGVYPKR